MPLLNRTLIYLNIIFFFFTWFLQSRSFPLYMLTRYPFLRKVLAILGRYVKMPEMGTKSGVLSVSLEGKPVALYTDPALSGITSGVKIGRHLYFGSLEKDHISRLDLSIHPARVRWTAWIQWTYATCIYNCIIQTWICESIFEYLSHVLL